jgi:hypothetical protein
MDPVITNEHPMTNNEMTNDETLREGALRPFVHSSFVIPFARFFTEKRVDSLPSHAIIVLGHQSVTANFIATPCVRRSRLGIARLADGGRSRRGLRLLSEKVARFSLGAWPGGFCAATERVDGLSEFMLPAPSFRDPAGICLHFFGFHLSLRPAAARAGTGDLPRFRSRPDFVGEGEDREFTSA